MNITKAVDASPTLRDKKELIEEFVDSLTSQSDVEKDWIVYINDQKRKELDSIVKDEHLKADKTKLFMSNAFRQGYVAEGGMELDGILPPLDPFDPNAHRKEKLERVVDRLKAFFSKFFSVADGKFEDP